MNPQIRRSVVDFGPLLLFFIAYKFFDLYAATATVMAAAVAAVVLLNLMLDARTRQAPAQEGERIRLTPGSPTVSTRADPRSRTPAAGRQPSGDVPSVGVTVIRSS